MELTRRNMMAVSSGAFLATGLSGLPAFASAVDDAIAEFTGGAEVGEGGIDLNAPEIAENGNTVPIDVAAKGAAAIMLLADGNPQPGVVTFNFGPLNPTQSASTRIRLAQTQNVIAVAKMQDGTFTKTQAAVKVTIGGCGG
jgi:sulfur-oxidizing protein SoxY